MRGPECRGTSFEFRVQRWTGQVLYRCLGCGRVARTKRTHQIPGPTTASHDKTMAILWDSATPTSEPAR